MDGDGVAFADHLGHAIALAGKLERLRPGNVVDLEIPDLSLKLGLQGKKPFLDIHLYK